MNLGCPAYLWSKDTRDHNMPEKRGQAKSADRTPRKTRVVRWHGSNAGHSSGVAGVDARRATPPDPRLARWGLASCCQLDPSHPARVAREDPGVEPCLSLRVMLVSESACGMASASISRPGATRNWVRLACVTCYEMLRFPVFLKICETRL